MSLYESPPESITVDGVEYPIDTDFRFWIRFQTALLSGKTEEEKAKALCEIMGEASLPMTKSGLDAAVKFYAGASTENPTNGEKKDIAFDFEKDSEFIFSAFMDSYGIDLTTERLHWWRFKALFKSLPEDCQMCKIMMYRTIDLKKVPKDQRPFYREMKKRYALEKVETGYRTKEEIIAYVRKRQAEAQSQVSALRSSKRPSAH